MVKEFKYDKDNMEGFYVVVFKDDKFGQKNVAYRDKFGYWTAIGTDEYYKEKDVTVYKKLKIKNGNRNN